MLLAASARLAVFFTDTRGRAVPSGAAAATGLATALLTIGIIAWQGLLAGHDLTGGDHAAIEAAASGPSGSDHRLVVGPERTPREHERSVSATGVPPDLVRQTAPASLVGSVVRVLGPQAAPRAG